MILLVLHRCDNLSVSQTEKLHSRGMIVGCCWEHMWMCGGRCERRLQRTANILEIYNSDSANIARRTSRRGEADM
jgi:hypothetical protein